jgi:hypothetical protein
MSTQVKQTSAKQNSATTIYNVIPIIKNVASQKQDPNFFSPNAARLWRQTSKTTKEAVNNSHNLQERYYEKLQQTFTLPVGNQNSTRKQLFSIKQYIDMMSPALSQRALVEFMMMLFKNKLATNMLWIQALDYLVMKIKGGSLDVQDMLNKCFLSFNDLKANTSRIEAFNSSMREMASHSEKIAIAISYLMKQQLINQENIITAVAQLGINWGDLRSCDWFASNLYMMNFNNINENDAFDLVNNADTYHCDNNIDKYIIQDYFKECKRNPKRFLKMYCEVAKYAVTNPTRYLSYETDDEVETVYKFPITSSALQSLGYVQQYTCRSVQDIIKLFFNNPPNIAENGYIGDLNSLVFNQKVVKIIYAYTLGTLHFVRFVCPVMKKPNTNMFCLVELSLDYPDEDPDRKTLGILKLFDKYEDAKAECTNVVSGLASTVSVDTSKDAKFAWDLDVSKAGGSTRRKYKGRSYVVKTGPRGGKYLVSNGKKVYL